MGSVRVLRGRRGFRRLVVARGVSFLGDSLGLVALLLFVEAETGAALAVALLLLAGDFTPGLFGAFAGVVGDRVDLRKVMVGCDLAQGVLVLAMAVVLPPLPVLLVLVAVRSLVAQVFQASSRSAVPALVADEELEAANSALGGWTYGLDAVGPLIAAALFLVLDVRGILLIDAATFFVSAVLLWGLPSLPPSNEHSGTSVLANAKEGLGYIWRTRAVRVIGLGFFAVVAFSGVDDVAMVFLAKDELRGGDSAAAVLYAGVGIGLVAGYALLTKQATRFAMPVLLIVGFAISSLGNLFTGFAWAIWAALALQTIRGLGIAALDVAINTHLQRVVPAAMLGRVFGNLYGAIGLAAGLSYVFGGLLLEHTDARTTFIAAGAGGLLATAATAISLARRARQ
ncbi:MFS transporter [Kribbella sp. CA-293567]|uniref:MFS transporter n=1 Tax=Kribbella sp. CA-293567 TaxID=3002436 RepID=UPI0022DD8E2E|nr:MFS transporter [Kribbella sp. CA-293567]WBQ04330.1 MFS transporter [Kribbella sp. CA-293567]